MSARIKAKASQPSKIPTPPPTPTPTFNWSLSNSPKMQMVHPFVKGIPVSRILKETKKVEKGKFKAMRALGSICCNKYDQRIPDSLVTFIKITAP